MNRVIKAEVSRNSELDTVEKDSQELEKGKSVSQILEIVNAALAEQSLSHSVEEQLWQLLTTAENLTIEEIKAVMTLQQGLVSGRIKFSRK